MKLFDFVSLLILIGFIASHQVNGLNLCGGERRFDEDVILGEYCDCGLGTECPFGTTVCGLDKNTIMCMPNCSITVKVILEVTKAKMAEQTIIIPTCKNGGFFDYSRRACICPLGYQGDLCEIADLCLNVNCNNQGRCEMGRCICDVSYMGDDCSIRKDCRTSNLKWTGTKCVCNKGWMGLNCEQCSNTSICLPNLIGPSFSLVSLNNPFMMQALLLGPAPPQYKGIQPFRPTPSKYDCQCMLPQVLDDNNPIIARFVEKHANTISRFHDNDDVDDDNDELHPYIGHFWHEHFENDCGTGATIIGFLLFFLILFLFCACCFMSERRRSTLMRMKAQEANQAPTITVQDSSPQFNSPTSLNFPTLNSQQSLPRGAPSYFPQRGSQ
jgi:hypothetical protein